MNLSVGLDLGNSKTTCVVFDAFERKTLHQSLSPPIIEMNRNDVLNQIVAIVERITRLQGCESKNSVVGVGFPSMVDAANGRILKSAALPQWNDFQLVEVLERELNCRVFLENDVNAAAYGEWIAGAALGVSSVVYLNLGSGVGGALIEHGRIYRGFSGLAGELGYVTFSWADQNNQRIYENLYSLISGKSLSAAFAYLLRTTEHDPVLSDYWDGDYENINVEIIARAMKSGSKIAKQLLDDAARMTGVTVANLINLLDPELVVIGGGISTLGGWFSDSVTEEARKHVNPAISSIRMATAVLEPYSGAIGMAALALSTFRRDTPDEHKIN